MTSSIVDPSESEFDLVRAGYSHRMGHRLGLARTDLVGRLTKVLLIVAVTWLPLLLLSLLGGHAVGSRVVLPFFYDPEVHARFLIVLPLLELAEIVVALSLGVQARHLLEMGIVPHEQRPAFRRAQAAALRLRASKVAEICLVVMAYALSLGLRLGLGITEGASSWERDVEAVTLAGWWNLLVSLPLLYFFLLRWLLVFAAWAQFLFRVSRLNLKLTPTHPDRTGGLGFLGWGLACFATVLAAVSTVFSAAFAAEILQHGESLNSLKFHIIIFAVTALFVLHAPLLAFSGQLSRCRFTGLLEFGALVWRHDCAFDEKWIKDRPSSEQESILGSSDVQSMADIATCYEHINDMRLLPFDSKAFAVLAMAALLPMLPLIGTAIPLQEIVAKLGELLL